MTKKEKIIRKYDDIWLFLKTNKNFSKVGLKKLNRIKTAYRNRMNSGMDQKDLIFRLYTLMVNINKLEKKARSRL